MEGLCKSIITREIEVWPKWYDCNFEKNKTRLIGSHRCNVIEQRASFQFHTSHDRNEIYNTPWCSCQNETLVVPIISALTEGYPVDNYFNPFKQSGMGLYLVWMYITLSGHFHCHTIKFWYKSGPKYIDITGSVTYINVIIVNTYCMIIKRCVLLFKTLNIDKW